MLLITASWISVKRTLKCIKKNCYWNVKLCVRDCFYIASGIAGLHKRKKLGIFNYFNEYSKTILINCLLEKQLYNAVDNFDVLTIYLRFHLRLLQTVQKWRGCLHCVLCLFCCLSITMKFIRQITAVCVAQKVTIQTADSRKQINKNYM